MRFEVVKYFYGKNNSEQCCNKDRKAKDELYYSKHINTTSNR